jgi:hypothetical protein
MVAPPQGFFGGIQLDRMFMYKAEFSGALAIPIGGADVEVPGSRQIYQISEIAKRTWDSSPSSVYLQFSLGLMRVLFTVVGNSGSITVKPQASANGGSSWNGFASPNLTVATTDANVFKCNGIGTSIVTASSAARPTDDEVIFRIAISNSATIDAGELAELYITYLLMIV